MLYVLGDITSRRTHVTIADNNARSARVHCTIVVLTPSIGTVLIHVLCPTQHKQHQSHTAYIRQGESGLDAESVSSARIRTLDPDDLKNLISSSLIADTSVDKFL